LKARLGEIETLRGLLGERNNQLREWDGRYTSALRGKNDEIGILQARMAELEGLLKQRTEELEQARRSVASKPGRKDDLKKIYGVGPVLARMLNKLGIYTFREVALWTDEDIDRVDEQLEHFRGRIRREDWVSSAKEEHFKKYGERI
jgi:predicted flap endonuclease-1-like 5' DNA nuclease